MEVASFGVGKDFFTDRNRTFDFGVNNFLGEGIKVKIHNIEVIAAVNSTHEGDIFIPMMCELVAMTAKNPIDCSLRQIVNKSNDFISFAGLLLSQVATYIVSFVPWALVPEMCQHQNDLRSCCSQRFCLSYCDGWVFVELVCREFVRNKPGRSSRGFCRRKANDS